MAILEQVIRMKEEGVSEGEIISQLSQRGISPKEISEALRQAQIKSAVSNTGDEEEMQPSITEEVPNPDNQVYTPQGYEQQQQEEYVPQYMPQEEYPQGYEQYVPAGLDTNTVMEVADQVFSDRIRKTQKQVDNLTETSTLLQTKMENVSDRLKKIETTIDKLQIAILEKVGSYGRNLEGIKKEMSMMQDSFSKMISPRKTKGKD